MNALKKTAAVRSRELSDRLILEHAKNSTRIYEGKTCFKGITAIQHINDQAIDDVQKGSSDAHNDSPIPSGFCLMDDARNRGF